MPKPNDKHSIFKLILTLSCMLLLLAGCAGMRPDIEIPAAPPPPLKLNYQPQVAVVLGGGGARGYAHIGVLKVLHDAGVPINLIAGTSAGSLIGALYADTASPTDTYNRIFYTHFWKLADIGNLNLKGIMTGYHLQRFLLTNLKAHDFNQLKIPLIVATTDLTTGKTYVISNGPIAPAVQASSAIPGVFLPVHLYGHVLVDGGVSDSIPVNLVKPYRPSVIIAVDISPQLSQKMPATATGILERSLLILREKASAQNLQEANITIRPHVGQAGAFDVKDKHQLYDAGVQAAQQQLPAILKLLKEKNITLSSAQHVGWAVKPNNILTVRRRFTQLNKYFFRFTSGNRSTA